MKQMRKRGMAFLLSLVMVVGLFAGVPMKAEAAGGVQAKINEILSNHPTGSYFSANGQRCSHDCYSVCNNCDIVYIDNEAYRCIGNECWTCKAFANSTFYRLFGIKMRENGNTITDVYSVNSLISTAKTGDFIACFNSAGTEVHAGIYLRGGNGTFYLYESNVPNIPNRVSYGEYAHNGSGDGWSWYRVFHAKNYDSINAQSPSVSYETYGTGGSRGRVSDTNATLYSVIHTSARSDVWVGLRIGTSSGNWNVRIHEEGLSSAGYNQLNSNGYFETWFECNNELGIQLSEGTTYYYQFYLKIGGKEYADSVRTFRTTGTSYNDPVGCVDSISSYNDQVYISGWTFDWDVPTTALKIHIYMGGPAGKGTCVATATANKERCDVGAAYSGVGNYHGFDLSFTTSLRGNQSVYVYAINAGGGDNNPCIGSGTVNVKDDTKPTVSNMKIYDVTNKGYWVSCTVRDNVGVTSVKFPTWISGWSESQIKWLNGTLNGNTATCYVKASDFTGQSIKFRTEVRAYDKQGNVSDAVGKEVFIDQNAPVISDIRVENEDEEGYTISCAVTDDYSGVSKVCFATKLAGENPADGWQEKSEAQGRLEDGRYLFGIPFDEYDYVAGRYTTTIYTCDGFGNSTMKNYSHDVYGDVQNGDLSEGENVPNGLWIAGLTQQTYTYTGSTIKPEVRVYDKSRLLSAGRDYSISYKNNTKANDASEEKTAPTVTIKGKGNYTGKDSITFVIAKKDLSDLDVTAENIVKKINGKEQKVIPTLTYNGKKLSNKKDFILSYPNTEEGAYREAGEYTILVTGTGNYTGSREICLTLTGAKLVSKLSISKISDQTYTGSNHTPSLIVKDVKKVLTEGTDYTVSYEKNREVGTAAAIITGKGNYAGTRKAAFRILAKASIAKAKIRMITEDGWDYKEAVYSGKEIKPAAYSVAVVVSGENGQTKTVTLTEGIDYTVSYTNHVRTGTATVTFSGINGCSGIQKKTYKIKPYDLKDGEKAEERVSVQLQTAYAYTKGGCRPKPVVTFDGMTLAEGVDYTLSYQNTTKLSDDAKEAEQPMVTVRGKGNFKGSITASYQITVENLNRTTLTAKDIVWKNKAGIYQVKAVIKDSSGKTLAAGKDYEKKLVYAYCADTELADGTVRTAGEEVQKKDILPAGTQIRVTAQAKEGSGYQGTVSGTYRVTKADIAKASVKIPAQYYTGRAIEVDQVIEVKMNRQPLSSDNYEIVGYRNNKNKGTATAIIRGRNDCGGTKMVTFKIKSKGFLWWWR